MGGRVSDRLYAVRVLKFRTYWINYRLSALSQEEARAIVQGLIEEEEHNYFDRLPEESWEYEEDAGYRIDTVRRAEVGT